MKKFLISLLILVILAGVAFFFGWVSFRLQSDEYAVVFTKSDGWITEPVKPGEFRWMWQALIPTNLEVHSFSIAPREATIDESGTLPSAVLYAQYVEGNPSFGYSLELTLSYRVRPEAVAMALAEERTTPEDIESFHTSMEGRLRNSARRAVVTAIEELGEEPTLDALPRIATSVESALQNSVAEVELLGVSIENAEVPDPFVYRTARENYRAIQEGRQVGLRETARDAAVQRVLNEERREALEEYGRILQEYPVLLDYFQLAAESGTDPLELDIIQSAIQEAE